MFSQPSTIINDLNGEPVLSTDHIKFLTHKRKRDEQKLNDRAIEEALAAEDGQAFANQHTNNQSSNKELETIVRGTHITPVPKWHSTHLAPIDAANINTMPAEIRGLTLGLVGVMDDQFDEDHFKGVIVGETKEHPYAPTSHKKFAFFNQTDLPVTAFLTHVVRGEMQAAKAMLDKNPLLVLYRGQVTDYSGRTIEGTAYQIALGAEDISRKDHPEEGMADMMKFYFIKALGNEEKADEEMKKQFKEQFPEKEFPEYYETDEKKREEIIKRKNTDDPDLKILETLANTILIADAKEITRISTGKKDKYGDEIYNLEVTGECAKALQVFRDYLKPTGVIKKGKHFNVQLLVKALEKYVRQQHDDFGGNWNDPKNVLFWRQVIGYLERYLPANYAQAFCQGLYHVTDEGQPLKRDLKLENKSFFYPSHLDSSTGLGFDHSVYSGGCGWLAPELEGGGGSRELCQLMLRKNNSLSNAYAALRKSINKEFCVRDTVVLCRRNNNS